MAFKKGLKRVFNFMSLPIRQDFVSKLLPGKTMVLYFHGVEKDLINSDIQINHYPLAQFQETILYVKKHFEILSIDDFYDLYLSKKLPSKTALITFDDGYKNNLINVAPFLNDFDVPFTIFVSTKHISTGEYFPTFFLRALLNETKCSQLNLSFNGKSYSLYNASDRIDTGRQIAQIIKTADQQIVQSITQDLRKLFSDKALVDIKRKYSSDAPMTWGELKAITKYGATIGSHCDDHMILHKNQSHREIDHQLKESKRQIEKNIGACKYFAFPNGKRNDYTSYAKKRLLDFGYLMGFSTEEALVTHNSNPFTIPRLSPLTPRDVEFSYSRYALRELFKT